MARRYPLPRLMPIPNDTNEAQCDAVGLFCFPDTPEWRRVIAGLMAKLTYGRAWDEGTGIVKDAQAVGSEIFGSLCIMCIDDLLEAINGISSSIEAQTVQMSVCCSTTGGGVGTEEPGVDITEGETPPAGSGFSPLPDPPGSQAYQSRKCKVANWIIEQLATLLSDLQPIELLSQVTVASVTAIVTAALAALATGPLAIGIAVVALLANVVAYLVAGQADLAGLSALVTANHDDLVCALYESTSSDGAKTALVAALGAAGANQVQTGLVEILIDYKPLSALFAQSDSPAGVVLEESLPDYTPPYDCSGCEEPCEPFLLFLGTVVSQGANSVTIAPELVGGLWKIQIYFNVEETAPDQFAYCGPGATVTGMTTTNNLLGGVAEDNPNNAQIAAFHFNPANGILPQLPYNNVGNIRFTYNTGETGQVTVTWS